jgi:hypothetical protein
MGQVWFRGECVRPIVAACSEVGVLQGGVLDLTRSPFRVECGGRAACIIVQRAVKCPVVCLVGGACLACSFGRSAPARWSSLVRGEEGTPGVCVAY